MRFNGAVVLHAHSYARRRACEVTRLLFIMHKFHIELNHHSQIENAIYNLHKKQASTHTQ